MRLSASQRLVVGSCLAGLAVGCMQSAQPATARQLRTRAAFELGCPAEYIGLVRIDETTGGVAGCGRRVIYVEVCDARGRCSWEFQREVPPPMYGGWTAAPVAAAPPRNSPYPSGEPPRSSPYSPPEGAGHEADVDADWRSRVPRLLRDDPGF